MRDPWFLGGLWVVCAGSSRVPHQRGCVPTGLPPPAPTGSPRPQCLRQEAAFPSWSPQQLSATACVRPRNSSSQGTPPWGALNPTAMPGTLGACTDRRGSSLSPAVTNPAEPHACPVVSHQAVMGPVCLCSPISWVMAPCRAPAALGDQDGATTLSGGPGDGLCQPCCLGSHPGCGRQCRQQRRAGHCSLSPQPSLENKFLKSWENAEPWLCWTPAQSVAEGSAGPVTTWLAVLNLCHCGTCWVCWVHRSPGVPVPSALCLGVPVLWGLCALCAQASSWDEGSLCMVKQGRGPGSHHRCTWPCPEQTATGEVGLHIWAAVGSNAPHHSPREHKAVEH